MSLFLCTMTAEAFQARVIELGPGQTQRKTASTLTILGGVEQPACFEVEAEETSLAQLIEMAGGLTASAGKKIRVLRGERAGIYLMFPEQGGFLLQRGDIVLVEAARSTSARIVSFESANLSQAPQQGPEVIRTTGYEAPPPVRHDYVVLLGLRETPVVMPLWEPGLTADRLLTDYLHQTPKVAATARLLAGQYATHNPGALREGMVLSVNSRLVNRNALPRLPEVVSSRTPQPTSGSAEGSSPTPSEKAPAPAPPQTSNTLSLGLKLPTQGSELILEPRPSEMPAEANGESTQDSLSEVLDPLPIPYSTSEETTSDSSLPLSQESASAELTPVEDFFKTLPQPSTETETLSSLPSELSATLPSMEQLLQEHRTEPTHLARQGEDVPAPRDLRGDGKPSMIGFIAGFIVVGGVLVVILSAVKTQIQQDQTLLDKVLRLVTLQHGVRAERGFLADSPRQPILTAPTPPSPLPQRELPACDAPGSARVPETPTYSSEPEALADAIALPLVEERVVLPREMRFFGMPRLHYEFRIDARHGIPRPHSQPAGTRAQTNMDEIIDRCRVNSSGLSTEDGMVNASQGSQSPEPLASSPVMDGDHFPPPDSLFAQAYALHQSEQRR